jgi:ABC-2 type transport system permease protein
MNFTRALAIGRKEFYHLLRDRLNLAVALLLPVVIVSTLGAAIEFNVRDLRLAVYDRDQTAASRRLIETFTSSGYFKPVVVDSPAAALSEIESDRARAALLIEPDFEKRIRSGRGARAQVLVDGSDSATLGPIQGYVASIQSLAAEKITGEKHTPVIRVATRYFYNPELRSRWYFVPGVGVVSLAILSILLTSVTVAKEWESGSMELLLSTPAEPIEIIVGKILPYLGLGFIGVSVVYVVARVVFGVPFEGSLAAYAIGTLLFLFACFAQGILISVSTPVQQIATQNALVSGLMPALLLSGFIFSISNMPKVFQVITAFMGVRWFMQISRVSYLAEGLSGLAFPLLCLTGITAGLVSLAIAKFKTDVEP